MSEIEFSYDARITQTGLMTLRLPAHFLVMCICEKLSLPLPSRNRQCEVMADGGSVEEGSADHIVVIDFEYMSDSKDVPIKVTFTVKDAVTGLPPPDEDDDGAFQNET